MDIEQQVLGDRLEVEDLENGLVESLDMILCFRPWESFFAKKAVE